MVLKVYCHLESSERKCGQFCNEGGAAQLSPSFNAAHVEDGKDAKNAQCVAQWIEQNIQSLWCAH